MSHRAQSAHLGGALSCVDILTSLYWTTLKIDKFTPNDPLRDRLVFSKGHAVSALYAVLAKRGFISETDLLHYN
jgi:transketolase